MSPTVLFKLSGLLDLVKVCLDPSSKVSSLDIRQNLVTLDGLEAAAFLILDYAEDLRDGKSAKEDPAGTITASLRKENNNVFPILEIDLPWKKLVVDLRYNRLQHSSTESDVSSTSNPPALWHTL